MEIAGYDNELAFTTTRKTLRYLVEDKRYFLVVPTEVAKEFILDLCRVTRI
jgi:hypothetical protein